ncbi:MAG: tetratricopeptide repeat protein [Chthonomonadetes bacterium]|nr:tetratricopeptide repeat protein [Chthonomonadetes bacterium]
MPVGEDDELRREQIEKLLREAYIYQMRNELLQAEQRCRQVLELDASNAEALELLGDIQERTGRLEEAVQSYRQARDLSPVDSPRYASAERKYAAAVLKQQGISASDLPPEPASPLMAIAASLVFPGLAQWLMNDRTKGGVLMGIWLILLLLMAFSPWGVQNIERGGWAFLSLAAVMASVYIVALVDAYQVSRRGGVRRKPKSGWEV